MGIKGIYHEIGPGQRIALSKLAIEAFEQKGKPLRLAIDISIWLFQIQSGKGGTNPALRTFFYRLLRLISLSIHPLFVFDGPNKPPFKRNKRTGPNVASIPEFLAKQLLKQFGLPFHQAPGEAEAECALLQRKGVVDAVLSEDVDTLMFGSVITLRNWSCLDSSKSNKTPTHVNLYDANQTKETSGLDREGMILVAVMSGGDYIPEGIPGCGPKTACEAARAGFGKTLCALTKKDRPATQKFLARLRHELSTNESSYFSRKRKALVIPDDFPRFDVLKYYTHPVISTEEKIEQLRNDIKWDLDIDIPALRLFTIEAFNWVCVGGAKHFVRNMAPPLLAKKLRLRAGEDTHDNLTVQATREKELVKALYGKRVHVSSDSTPEVRVGYVPIELCPVDMSSEEPDPEDIEEEADSEADPEVDEDGGPLSPKKKRAPTSFNPHAMEKIWLMDSLVRAGVPLTVQDYEESFRNARKYEALKAASKRVAKAPTSRKKKTLKDVTTNRALDSFTKVTKPTLRSDKISSRTETEVLFSASQLPTILDMTGDDMSCFRQHSPASGLQKGANAVEKLLQTSEASSCPLEGIQAEKHSIIDLVSSPENRPAPRKRPFRRSLSDTSHLEKSGFGSSAFKGAHAVDASHTLDNRLSEEEEALPPSVSIRPRKSPVKQALSKPTFQNGKMQTKVQSSKDGSQTGLSEATASQLSAAALSSTPRRSRPIDIITISSSPQTPASTQRSIKQYLSPRSPRLSRSPPSSPTPARTKNGTNTPRQIAAKIGNYRQAMLATIPATLALDPNHPCFVPITNRQELSNSSEDLPILEPASTPAAAPRGPTQVLQQSISDLAAAAQHALRPASADAVAATVLEEEGNPITRPAAKSVMRGSPRREEEKAADTIRLRQSLIGGFALGSSSSSSSRFDDHSPAELRRAAPTPAPAAAESGVRSRTRTRTRTWRTSRVDVLDLTQS